VTPSAPRSPNACGQLPGPFSDASASSVDVAEGRGDGTTPADRVASRWNCARGSNRGTCPRPSAQQTRGARGEDRLVDGRAGRCDSSWQPTTPFFSMSTFTSAGRRRDRLAPRSRRSPGTVGASTGAVGQPGESAQSTASRRGSGRTKGIARSDANGRFAIGIRRAVIGTPRGNAARLRPQTPARSQ
jgi:hypothetical protein